MKQFKFRNTIQISSHNFDIFTQNIIVPAYFDIIQIMRRNSNYAT